ncbi:MAG: RNA-directed DNA polymerase [Rhodobacter sp.]|nr:RNA-directed DNA polymerase [Rhodobacter sp.]
MKAVQSRIATLLARIQPPDFLFSPVKGRSYVDNAAQHIGSKAFWLLDVADYFPSCSANNVARFFHRDMNCSADVAAVLVKLVTLQESLPQGSPCSPILAYYCNRPMWLAIESCVARGGCKLSLYADDITISGDVVRKRMIWEIKKIVHGSGLKLKSSKEVSLISAPADITGVIVKPSGTHLPNRQLKKLAELKKQRAMTHNPKDRAKLENQIAGRVAQRRQVEHFQSIDE